MKAAFSSRYQRQRFPGQRRRTVFRRRSSRANLGAHLTFSIKITLGSPSTPGNLNPTFHRFRRFCPKGAANGVASATERTRHGRATGDLGNLPSNLELQGVCVCVGDISHCLVIGGENWLRRAAGIVFVFLDLG